MEDREGQSGFRVAPTWMRIVAGVLDLALVGAVATLVTAGWYVLNPVKMPPRYWNYLDYLVDLINTRPDISVPPLVILAGVFLLWETLWTAAIGNTPAARLAGMRVCVDNGRRPQMLRLVARTVFEAVGFAAGLVGPLTALVHPRRKMLHDILAGCLVVRGPVPAEWNDSSQGSRGGHPLEKPRTYRDGPRR
ncbi:MAG: RDD family protein [Deltaproteobacteria bacterium]|nr:RDD family protein [Deltaproteobacteria bacterium]